MTSVSKNMYIVKLVDIVNNYSNTYHSTIKMKPADVGSSTNIDFNKENNKENPKFEVGVHVKISRYKNIFIGGTLQTGLKTFLWLKRLKSQCCGDILLVILMGRNYWDILRKVSW